MDAASFASSSRSAVLRPENIAEAIRTVRPFGVDLCTGLRTADRLDEAKLAAFMQGVASA